MLKTLGKYRDFGLLLLRTGLGGMFLIHGQGKLFGGLETWESLGGAMANYGIDFAPALWGFLAAFAEFGGGILLIFGFLFRPACFLLAFTMLTAAFMHYSNGDPFIPKVSYPLELMIVYISLLFIGPGKYSFDRH